MYMYCKLLLAFRTPLGMLLSFRALPFRSVQHQLLNLMKPDETIAGFSGLCETVSKGLSASVPKPVWEGPAFSTS